MYFVTLVWQSYDCADHPADTSAIWYAIACAACDGSLASVSVSCASCEGEELARVRLSACLVFVCRILLLATIRVVVQHTRCGRFLVLLVNNGCPHLRSLFEWTIVISYRLVISDSVLAVILVTKPSAFSLPHPAHYFFPRGSTTCRRRLLFLEPPKYRVVMDATFACPQTVSGDRVVVVSADSWPCLFSLLIRQQSPFFAQSASLLINGIFFPLPASASSSSSEFPTGDTSAGTPDDEGETSSTTGEDTSDKDTSAEEGSTGGGTDSSTAEGSDGIQGLKV